MTETPVGQPFQTTRPTRSASRSSSAASTVSCPRPVDRRRQLPVEHARRGQQLFLRAVRHHERAGPKPSCGQRLRVGQEVGDRRCRARWARGRRTGRPSRRSPGRRPARPAGPAPRSTPTGCARSASAPPVDPPASAATRSSRPSRPERRAAPAWCRTGRSPCVIEADEARRRPRRPALAAPSASRTPGSRCPARRRTGSAPAGRRRGRTAPGRRAGSR